ncbi:MAG: hypothetical protein WDO13_05035 [Verrucomicrobiota bacterium]
MQTAAPIAPLLVVTLWAWWCRRWLGLRLAGGEFSVVVATGVLALLPAMSSATAMRLPALYAVLAILFSCRG